MFTATLNASLVESTICLWPGLFKRLVYGLRQLNLSKILAILLDLAWHKRNNHNTITQRSIQLTMVNHGPELQTHSQSGHAFLRRHG